MNAKSYNGCRYTRNICKNNSNKEKLQTIINLLEKVDTVCNSVVDRNKDIDRNINITLDINVNFTSDTEQSNSTSKYHITPKFTTSTTQKIEKNVHKGKITQSEDSSFFGDTFSTVVSYDGLTTTGVSIKNNPNIIITTSGECASTYSI